MGTVAATGGTFDILHRGHRALLAAALENFDHTIIGLVTDGFAARLGKSPRGYCERRADLVRFLDSEFPGRSYEVSPLDDCFGPAVLRGDVDALVASRETCGRGDALNGMRERRGLAPVRVVAVPMVPGYDGVRISTTRIRDNQIDAEGNAP